MSVQSIRRESDWTWEQIDATPAQFRATLKYAEHDESVKLAVHAGKRMAKQLAVAGNIVPNLDRQQVEEWRRKFNVPRNRQTVMLMVAWSTLRYQRSAMTRKRETQGIGAAGPRKVAKQLVGSYGSLAEKIARRMMAKSDDKKHWYQVTLKVHSLLSISTPTAKVTLARQGAAKYWSYLAKQQRSLRTIPQPIQAPKIKVVIPRLLSRKETYAPTLCAICSEPARFGGTIFCATCQPKGEKS